MIFFFFLLMHNVVVSVRRKLIKGIIKLRRSRRRAIESSLFVDYYKKKLVELYKIVRVNALLLVHFIHIKWYVLCRL